MTSSRSVPRVPRPRVTDAAQRLRRLARRSHEVLLLCAVTGAVTGFAVALFDRIVVDGLFDRLMNQPLWFVALAPAVGLVLTAVALRWIGGPGTGSGTADAYLHAFHDPRHKLDLRGLAARMTAAICTLGSGGAMGLEGPSLFLGASVGATIQRRLPRPFRGADHRTLLVAGAAAGVAAIFKAPATGAVFALEVPYRDDLARRMLLPSLVAAASGYLAFVAVNGTAPLFAVTGDPAFTVRDLFGALCLGAVAGLGARAFSAGVRLAKRWASRPPLHRLLLAAPSIIVLFVAMRLVTGESLSVGSGYQVVDWATTGDRAVWALLAVMVLRCLATTITVAGGGVGGLFIPLVVAGALAGRATGDVVRSLDTGLFTVIGVAAFLGAGYRVPLAAVTFVAETTGRPGFVVPGLLAAVVAELVVGSASVTAYQRPTRVRLLVDGADGERADAIANAGPTVH